MQSKSNVSLLTNATVEGIYDGNLAVVAVGDDTKSIRARTIIFATGATERPMLFEDNDRPGTMLASALQTYANRYAVVPASRLIIATNNDSAYDAAIDLAAKGVEVFVVDERSVIAGEVLTRATAAGIGIFADSHIKATHGAPILD